MTVSYPGDTNYSAATPITVSVQVARSADDQLDPAFCHYLRNIAGKCAERNRREWRESRSRHLQLSERSNVDHIGNRSIRWATIR